MQRMRGNIGSYETGEQNPSIADQKETGFYAKSSHCILCQYLILRELKVFRQYVKNEDEDSLKMNKQTIRMST